MTPARVAATTAALRRDTHLFVCAGGRSRTRSRLFFSMRSAQGRAPPDEPLIVPQANYRASPATRGRCAHAAPGPGVGPSRDIRAGADDAASAHDQSALLSEPAVEAEAKQTDPEERQGGWLWDVLSAGDDRQRAWRHRHSR